MTNSQKKIIIGLLGGIGSGKSAVAAEFAKQGCRIVDADVLAHEALAREDVKQRVVDVFGPDVLDSRGEIDRAALAETVFCDGDKLGELTSIVHPFVLERMEQLVAQYGDEPGVPAVVLDVPLLAEVGWDRRCDMLVFVECDRKKRLQRAENKDSARKNDFEIREKFQISLDTKKRLADNTIDNNSDLSALVRQVSDILSRIA